MQKLQLALFSLAIVGLTGCSEQEDTKDDEVRESDSKDSSGKSSSGQDSSGEDSSGDNNDSGGNGGSGGDNDSGGSTEGGKDAPASMMNYSAGSRLTPVLLEADDGAKQFYGWHDTKLDVPCSFSMRSGATVPQEKELAMRCLPPMATVSKVNYFTNNSCDEDQRINIMVVSRCSDMEKFKYGIAPAKACGEEGTVYEIKSVKPLGSRDFIWHNMSTTRDCSIVTSEELENMAEVELGDPVDLSSFVTATTAK